MAHNWQVKESPGPELTPKAMFFLPPTWKQAVPSLSSSY